MSESHKGKTTRKGFKASEETKNKLKEAWKKRKERELMDSTLKRKVPEEQKKRMVETRKRNKEEKILNGTYVKRTLSEETRRRQSELKKGQVAWNKGKKLSDEHKRNVINGMRIKKEERIANGTYVKITRSEEFKQNMRKPKSEEVRKKMSESQMGKKRSSESIAKREETKRIIRQERLTMIF